ncbi:MAG: ATP-grasp domain-containing protein [Planctomycetaceae bacterium]
MASIILAGASVRSLAESALAAGFDPVCVDLFGDADLPAAGTDQGFRLRHCRIDDFADLPRVLTGFDRRLPMIWSGGLENHPDLLAEIAAARPVAGPDAESLRRVRNPLELCRVLTEAGCDVPAVRTAGEFGAGLQADEWLIKPLRGAGGIGIRRLGDSPQPNRKRPTGTSDCYLQQFVEGIPISAMFWATDAGTSLVGTCLQLAGESAFGATGFQFCGNFGPLNPDDDLHVQIMRCGDEIAKSFAVQGCFGVDFVVRNSRAFFIEVNPRITASHEIPEFCRSPDWNTIDAQLRAFDLLPPKHDDHKTAQASVGRVWSGGAICRMVLYAARDVVVTAERSNQMLALTRPPRGLAQTIRLEPTDGDATDDALLRVWLADIPAPSTVPAGAPFVSVYAQKLPMAFGNQSDLPNAATFEPLLRDVCGNQNFRIGEQFRRFEELPEISQTDNILSLRRASVPWRNLSYDPS